MKKIEQERISPQLKWARANKEKIKLYRRAHILRNKEKVAQMKKQYKKSNNLKIKCHQKVERSLKNGVLKKPITCQQCGKNAKLHAHHCDYSKPLEVIWMCPFCHKEWHKSSVAKNLFFAPYIETKKDKENKRLINSAKFYKKHCANGHEFSKENSVIRVYRGEAYRKCRICQRITYKKFMDKQKHKSKLAKKIEVTNE